MKSLVHVWTRDFTARRAVFTAEVQRRAVRLPAVTDPQERTIHREEDVIGAHITGNCFGIDMYMFTDHSEVVLTIANEPEFAFVAQSAHHYVDETSITAIPFIAHLRRSMLPDPYYTGAAERCSA